MTPNDRHGYAEHSYSEQMSLALDGRLTAQERAVLEAHLVVCKDCRAQWEAFQQIDLVLANAATVTPAPGFAARFATRLVKQQAAEAKRAQQRRVLFGVGVFVAGAATLALIFVPLLVAAWGGLNRLIASAPSLIVELTELVARWIVTFEALATAGRSIADVLGTPSTALILAGYVLMLVVVGAAWVWIMRATSRGAFRRLGSTALPVLVWL